MEQGLSGSWLVARVAAKIPFRYDKPVYQYRAFVPAKRHATNAAFHEAHINKLPFLRVTTRIEMHGESRENIPLLGFYLLLGIGSNFALRR